MKPSDIESPQEPRIYIWSLSTRLFHWLLVTGIAGAFLTEEEELISLHAALGYMAGALILFRFIWGIMGPAYSRFSDFPVSPESVKSFLQNIRKDHGYAGHNPAASVVMILIMVFVVLTVFSGICLLTSDGQGFFAGVIPLEFSQWVGEHHEPLAMILALLIFAHLAGILVDTLFHSKTGTLGSIFHGYKRLKTQGIRLSPLQKGFSFLWILSGFLIFVLSLGMQSVNFKGKGIEKSRYEQKRHNTDEDDD